MGNYKEKFPLHLAAYQGEIAVEKFLLVNGWNVNEKNNNGETPLVLALAGAKHRKSSEKCFTILKEAEATL